MYSLFVFSENAVVFPWPITQSLISLILFLPFQGKEKHLNMCSTGLNNFKSYIAAANFGENIKPGKPIIIYIDYIYIICICRKQSSAILVAQGFLIQI